MLQQSGETNSGLGWWRDRGSLLIGVVLVIIAAFAWIAVIQQSNAMQPAAGQDTMAGMDMPMSSPPLAEVSLSGAIAYLAAWGVMMAAMMLPSAIPMIALYHTMQRNFPKTGQTGISTTLFTLVYLIAWAIFGLPIYIASILIEHAAQTNPTFLNLLPYALACVLVVSGIYQLSPLKRACLRICQSPFGFLIGHWKNGYLGTLRIAFENAVYCMGCCWGLMIVLVAAGAMALNWVLLISVIVFAEKLLPYANWTARITGGALIGLGLLVAIQPSLAPLLRAQGM